jgi:pyridoxal 5'-phosphate synthase pdxT subunit
VKGLDAPFHTVFIRAPVIESVGEGVEVLSSFEGRIVVARKDRIMASSFHPELTNDSRLHGLFLEQVIAS